MSLAVVTGCSRGIGAAICQRLLSDGWAVIGLSRTSPPSQDGLFWFQWDAMNGGSLADIFASEGIDDIDALIHCAGSQEPVGPVETSDPEAWAASIQTNLIGAYHVVRAALPALKRSQDARVLLFSGGGAFSPRPNFSAYAASKAGIVALMESLAGEVPPNVTVNCVAPGFVPTGIHEPTLAAGVEVVGSQEYRHATQQPRHEMENAVSCVRHLLSPDAKGLTGKTISAVYDPWHDISPASVGFFNHSDIWTRTRVQAQRVPSPVGVFA